MCARMRSGASSSTMSTATKLACWPSESASARRRSSRRATTTTAALGTRASRCAVASPIPLDAPVTIATNGRAPDPLLDCSVTKVSLLEDAVLHARWARDHDVAHELRRKQAMIDDPGHL